MLGSTVSSSPECLNKQNVTFDTNSSKAIDGSPRAVAKQLVVLSNFFLSFSDPSRRERHPHTESQMATEQHWFGVPGTGTL